MLITTTTEFQNLMLAMQSSGIIVFDTETTGLNPFKCDKICGVSIGIPHGGLLNSWYISFRHETGQNMPLFWLHELLIEITKPNKTIITWNGKFDFHFVECEGVKVRCTHWDAMLAMHLANENEFSYELKPLAKKILGEEAVKDEADLKTYMRSVGIRDSKWKSHLWKLNSELVAPYAESDVQLAWRMFRIALTKLKSEVLDSLYYEISEYGDVTRQMELYGTPVNTQACREAKLEVELKSRDLLDNIRQRIVDPFGSMHESMWEEDYDFNPLSHIHTRRLLGVRSSAREFLEMLPGAQGELAKAIIEYRSLIKASSSFYGPFMDGCDVNNRLHPNFKLHGTITGRLSCTNPNMQAIPRNDNQFHLARRMVEAKAGYTLVSADYSQAELRLLAHYTQDPFMLNVYREGLDIHQLVADEINIDRQTAKPINFSMVYGAGIPATMETLKCSEQEAEIILNRYHKRIPGIRKLYWKTQNIAKSNGYIKFWTGRRRRYVPALHDQHKSMSNLIQGGVAEMMRIAMTKLHYALPNDAHMILQVHDEILVECTEKSVKQVSKAMKTCMETMPFTVPMMTDQKTGNNWKEMEPIT